MDKKVTILSLEQALALPYATQRFAQLGWRVIRIEPPADDSNSKGGDPNRYVGEDTGTEDLHSYFISPNIGKEAITLNLKKKEGRELLKTLVKKLNADVFMCNTLPMRYKQLGIDFETLKEANPDLIWCGISALGPDYPDRAGYDPAMQAMLGYMYLNGEPDRDPMLCGVPVIDLKAGDEAFAQVLMAMYEQAAMKKSGGKEIFISMAQCSASWMVGSLPQLQFVKNESELHTRCGNENRSFVPCNCYATKDGHIYLAIGNNSQWEKLFRTKGFECLEKEEWKTNQGRLNDKNLIYDEIRKGMAHYTTSEFVEMGSKLGLAVSPVNNTVQVSRLEFIQKNMMKAKIPSGKIAELFPAPVSTDFLKEHDFTFSPAPRLGENNMAVYQEAGFSADEIADLKNNKII
ncbi:MAG: CoA transferase [Bacteroidetes bacterium]|nr:CoA transferase [Bacteroidota bacterium]